VASLKDVLRGRRDSEATALVAAALQRLEESSWMAERELRELPEVRAILDSPDELRRECIPRRRRPEGRLRLRAPAFGNRSQARGADQRGAELVGMGR
jgi:hypothetical protein